MDNVDECPEDYRDASAEAALEGTRALIDYEKPSLTMTIPVCFRWSPALHTLLLRRDARDLIRSPGNADATFKPSCSGLAHGCALSRYGATDTGNARRFWIARAANQLAHANFLTADDMEKIGETGPPLRIVRFRMPIFPMPFSASRRAGKASCRAWDRHFRRPQRVHVENCRGAVQVSTHARKRCRSDNFAGEPRGKNPARIDFKDASLHRTTGGGVALDLRR